jgi:hypothetical protein
MATNNDVDIPDTAIDEADEVNDAEVVDTTPQEIEPEPDKGLGEYLITLIKNNAFVVILIIVLLAYIFLFSSLGNRNRPYASSSSMANGAMNLGANAGANPLKSLAGAVKSATSGATSGATDNLSSGGNDKSGKYLLELFLWSIFVVLIMLNGVLYIFNVDVVTSITNLLGNVPQVEVIVDTEGVKKLQKVKAKEVYHIPGNHYDYEAAKAICKARDSKLASYSEMSDAFDKGADWCGYGWSEGQMALFPTQMEKWEKLQKIDGHANDCGRPGINGGYIDNPAVRYGVNCFGDKSKITAEEALLMSESTLYPKTQKELDFDKKVDYWRTKIPDILLAPFNHNNWSIL